MIGSPFYRENSKYYYGWNYFRIDKIEPIVSTVTGKLLEVVMGLVPITKEEYDKLVEEECKI